MSLAVKKFLDFYRRAFQVLGFGLILSGLVGWIYADYSWWEPSIGIIGLLTQIVWLVPRFAENPFSDAPVSLRRATTNKLIGRDDELSWLLNTDGDLLIVGQPGSGKSFLTIELRKKKNVQFAIRNTPNLFEEWYRRFKPEVLVVDDAGIDPSLLSELLHFRNSPEVNFQIIATCWPSEAAPIRNALHIPESQEIQLKLLPPKQIVEVVKAADLEGPEDLLGLIVDQSRGCPGLAATLAASWLKGDRKNVAIGDALYDDLHAPLARLVGEEGLMVLATFALGGKFGLSIDVVANHLGFREEAVHRHTKRMAAAGVLVEMAANRLKVTPEVFSYVLARETYFCGAQSLGLKNLPEQVVPPSALVYVAIHARMRGGQVDDTWLRPMLESVNDDSCWEAYSWLGAAETRWILQEQHEQALKVVNPALHLVPEAVVPLLLDEYTRTPNSSNLFQLSPLQAIEKWVHAGGIREGEDFERRRALQQALLSWLNNNPAAIGTAVDVVAIALSPKFEDTNQSADRESVHIRTGVVSLTAMSLIQELWPEIRTWLIDRQITNWTPLFGLYSDWSYPHAMVELSQETKKEMDHFAHSLIDDFVLMGKGHQGVNRWSHEEGARINHVSKVELDEEFMALYPIQDFSEDYRLEERRWDTETDQLVQSWDGMDTKLILDKLVHFEQFAREVGLGHPNLMRETCRKLANQTDHPENWIEQIVFRKASADVLQPFLQKYVRLSPADCEELAKRCLSEEQYSWITAGILLTADGIPDALWEALEAQLSEYGRLVEVEISRNAIPEKRISKLLRHKDNGVVIATAVGLWNQKPRANIIAELRPHWEEAILSIPPDRLSHGSDSQSYWVKVILGKEPDLGFKWLIRHMENLEVLFSDRDLQFANELSYAQKERLLSSFPRDTRQPDLLNLLVSHDEELYMVLLRNQQLRHLHLVPLESEINNGWYALATHACTQGYNAEQVARAAFRGISGWSGKESDMLKGFLSEFEALSAQSDSRLKEIGEVGSQMAKERIQAVEEREYREMYN